MKKLLLFVSILTLVAFATSCGKKCTCVTKVDGKKVGKNVSTEYKAYEDYFEKSEAECKGDTYDIVDKNGKEQKMEIKCK